MAATNVLCTNGSRRDIPIFSIKCPCCGSQVTPKYLCSHGNSGVIFSQCPVSGCDEFFLLKEHGRGLEILPNHQLAKQTFSEIINSVSPSFGKIYNEAFAAEQMNLMEICGVGYRKALEFLIKDYAIQGKDEQIVDKIKRMLLAKCIDDYVDDAMVKAVAKRAVWLGNDETHYVRKWEEKDVHDLKGLIRLTTLWIEKERETERLLSEMPEGR
jgi:hypothetical protein